MMTLDCTLLSHMSCILSLCGLSFDFFFSSRRRHTRLQGDWSSDVCSSDLCTQFVHGKCILMVCRDVAYASHSAFTQCGLQIGAHGFPILEATGRTEPRTQSCTALVSSRSWWYLI